MGFSCGFLNGLMGLPGPLMMAPRPLGSLASGLFRAGRLEVFNGCRPESPAGRPTPQCHVRIGRLFQRPGFAVQSLDGMGN